MPAFDAAELLRVEKHNYLERLGHFWAMFRFHQGVQLGLLGGSLALSQWGAAPLSWGAPLLGGALAMHLSRLAMAGMLGLYHTQMEFMAVIAKLEEASGYFEAEHRAASHSWQGEPVGNLDQLAERRRPGSDSSQAYVRNRAENGRYARLIRHTFQGYLVAGGAVALYGLLRLFI